MAKVAPPLAPRQRVRVADPVWDACIAAMGPRTRPGALQPR